MLPLVAVTVAAMWHGVWSTVISTFPVTAPVFMAPTPPMTRITDVVVAPV